MVKHNGGISIKSKSIEIGCMNNILGGVRIDKNNYTIYHIDCFVYSCEHSWM